MADCLKDKQSLVKGQFSNRGINWTFIDWVSPVHHEDRICHPAQNLFSLYVWSRGQKKSIITDMADCLKDKHSLVQGQFFH